MLLTDKQYLNVLISDVHFFSFSFSLAKMLLDLDLDSSHIQLDTLGHTPTPSVSVKSCHLCSLPAEPIFCRSWLTVLLQFALGRPGPLLYPGTCQYSACCGIRWWSTWETCPSHRSRLSLNMLSMVRCPVLVLTSTFVILSLHQMPSTLLCHL